MNVTVKNPKIRIEVYKQFDNPDIDFSNYFIVTRGSTNFNIKLRTRIRN